MGAVSLRARAHTRPAAARLRRFAALLPFRVSLRLRSRYGHEPHSLPRAPVGMDCIDLVRIWVDRCVANRFRHACGRHAPRLGEAVRDDGPFVPALGPGDPAGHGSWTSIPSGETELLGDLAR